MVAVASGCSGLPDTGIEQQKEMPVFRPDVAEMAGMEARNLTEDDTVGVYVTEMAADGNDGSQGFDLSKFKGKQVSRFTYSVLNYPGQKEYIRANLLIYKNQVIGGDVCSVFAENGFMQGFAFPSADTSSEQ